MTNNPTIDGVSRGLIEMTIDLLQDLRRGTAIERKLRALLDAPVVERCTSCDDSGDLNDLTGEWRGYCTCPIGAALKNKPVVERQPDAIIEGCMTSVGITHVIYASTVSLKDKERVRLYRETPEVAALQSTIAQLQARIAQLESEASYAAATHQAAWDRMAELESGRGDVERYDRHYQGAWFEVAAGDVERFEKDGWKIRRLYTAPPAPVAAKYQERVEFEKWVVVEWPTAPIRYVRDMLPEDDPLHGTYCDECLQRAWVGWQARACLDATAALNGVKP